MNPREVVAIFYPGPKARLGELVVDAFVSESHSFSNEISEHPIESGGSIVDHVRNQPFCLSLDGIISNTPMSLVGLTAFDSVDRLLRKEDNNFSDLAFKKIEELFLKREPITIATSLKDYPNMVLEGLSVERGGGGNASIHFKCTAKQVRIVNQELIKLPSPKPTRTVTKVKKGLQETKPVPTKEAEIIKKEMSAIMSFFKG